MKAITIRQPWASLITAGVKTIETRPRPTSYRGRIAIHAAGRWEPGWHEWVNPDGRDEAAIWRQDVLVDHLYGHSVEAANDDRYWTVDVRHVPLGAVVGSAVITDCVPIVDRWPQYISNVPCLYAGGTWPATLWRGPRVARETVTDQLPFGDFTPGRWAWLLDDAKPTTERCPWCWGDGFVDGVSYPTDYGTGIEYDATPCPCCSDGVESGLGRCDPVPARGHSELWEWTP